MDYCLIDTHCHFDFPPFVGNETESLQLAQQHGVERLIVPTVSADRFQRVIDLSQTYQPIYAALGLHPIYINQHNDQAIEQLHHCLQQYCLQQSPDKLVAIGEIGLDNYIEHPQLARQITLLRQQLLLAKDFELPVILHSRRSHDLLAQQLKAVVVPRTGVVHGFSGSLQQALAFIRLGYYIGVGGVITYPRAQKTRQAIAVLPLTALVLETDAPDMPVSGFQGQANRPERINTILLELSKIRTESYQEIAEQIYKNTCQLFAMSR